MTEPSITVGRRSIRCCCSEMKRRPSRWSALAQVSVRCHQSLADRVSTNTEDCSSKRSTSDSGLLLIVHTSAREHASAESAAISIHWMISSFLKCFWIRTIIMITTTTVFDIPMQNTDARGLQELSGKDYQTYTHICILNDVHSTLTDEHLFAQD